MNFPQSELLDNLPEQFFASLVAKVNAQVAAGVDVINLGQGNPDKPTPDYIIEAASPDVFKDIGIKILSNGINLIPLSVGALADKEFYKNVEAAALENNSRVHIPAGAVGGFDVLRASMLMEDAEVSITTDKSPQSLNGAPFLKGRKLSELPAAAFAGIIGSLTNTVLVLGLGNLLLSNAVAAAFTDSGTAMAAEGVFYFFLSVIATNGIPECIAAALIVTALIKIPVFKPIYKYSPKKEKAD